MKVLHVIPSVALSEGGPSVAIRGMVAGLARLGVQVTVATTVAGDERPDRLPPHGERGAPDLRYFRRSLPGGWKASLPLGRWLYRHVGQFDVVHVHALFSFATIPACRSAWRAGVPYVLRPLGTLDPWSLKQGGWKKQPYFRLIERPHLERAAAIHATSPAEAEAVAALGFGERVRVIPLGVEPIGDAGGAGAAREAGGTVRLLFLSRLHPKKGLPLLLEALAELRRRGAPPVDLVVAGEGEPGYRAEMEAMTHRLGLGDRVTFAGMVRGEEKVAALREADLFVLPSYQENFGIAVAEALSAGLPVVVSDQVAIAADVRDAGAGLVVPCESGPLADAIGQLAAAPALRERMGEAAGRLARERYSWDAACRGVHALYRELIEARRERRSASSNRGTS